MERRRYNKILNRIIKRFPEISKDVRIVEFPRFIFWCHSFAERGIKNDYIFINKIRRSAEEESLKGQLAHELGHIILYHRKYSFLGDILHNFIKFLSWGINTDYSRKIERQVDIETIKRGYGKYLLAHRYEWEKDFSKSVLKSLYSRVYLTPKEIKIYMGKYKK